MKQYNGHRSWNAWNVSLWLHNDEGLYRAMLDYITQHNTKDRAARAMAQRLGSDHGQEACRRV